MYLIIGANGFLGSYLLRQIKRRTDEEVIAASRHIPSAADTDVAWIRCDITQESDITDLKRRTEGKRLRIIFLAAYHNPDLILQNPGTAWRINIAALAMFLNYFNEFECFYYSSTEVVYGNSSGKALTERSPLSPVSRYGQLKALAEHIVLAAGGNIVSFPVLMGPSLLPDRKHFYDRIVETLKAGQHVSMFYDQRRSMLDFATASECLVALMQNSEARDERIVNISGDEALSKYEVGLRIAQKHGCDSSLILPLSMKESDIFTELRANETVLDNGLLKRLLKRDSIAMVI